MKQNFETPIYLLEYNDGDNQFYIKRDDLLPFSFGGNKVRIANEYFNDLTRNGYNCIVTYGGYKSNMNRIIANYGYKLNIPCYVIISIDDTDKIIESFNVILLKEMGAKIIYCKKVNITPTIEKLLIQLAKKGLKPYYIYGNKYGKGNESISVSAYVNAFMEILNFEKQNCIIFDYIFHATGTGITQSGLICGDIENNNNKKIIGISIARDEKRGIESIENNIKSYFNNNISDKINNNIHFIDKYTCGGYGNYNYNICQTIKKILRDDGIALDRTYTGKAFWGMTKYIKENGIKNSKILFIHTGGMPLFFDDLLKKERG